MDKKLVRALQKLALEHNVDIDFSCGYCGHKCETLGKLDEPESYFVTITPKNEKATS